MSYTILVPIDGSEPSEHALAYVLDHHPDADVTALAVLDPADLGYGSVDMLPSAFEKWQEAAKQEMRDALEAAREQAASAGVALETELVVGTPARGIVQFAREHDVDHVVIGSHGRDGVSRVLLGSVAETVVRRAPVPVTVVR